MAKKNQVEYMLGNAEAFHAAAENSWDIATAFPADKRESYEFHGAVTVAATSIAFAIELALKALFLAHYDRQVSGHNLTELFKEIGDGIYHFIAIDYTNYITDTGMKPELIILHEGGVPDAKVIELRNGYNNTIEKVIEVHDKSFVKWRYNFESVNKILLVDYPSIAVLYRMVEKAAIQQLIVRRRQYGVE